MNLVYLIVADGTGSLKATFKCPEKVTVSEQTKLWRYLQYTNPIGDSRNYRASEGIDVPIGVYDLSNIDHVNRLINDTQHLTIDMGNPNSFSRS